jgi:hypothetical protein
MTLHDHDATSTEEMNAVLHAMLQAEACDLGTVALVLGQLERSGTAA